MKRIFPMLIFLVLFSVACTTSQKEKAVSHSGVARKIGEGPYGKFLVLRDPRTRRILKNTRYRLLLPADVEKKLKKKLGRKIDTGIGSYIGRTDKKGRTAFLKSQSQEVLDHYQVMEVVGEGKCGESFYIVDAYNKEPLAGMRYTITTHGKELASGYSDENGNSKYLMGPCGMDLEIKVYGPE